MTDSKGAFFSIAKDIYFERLKLKPKSKPNDKSQAVKNSVSKYQRAAELGLCIRCWREDKNPLHHPLQPQFFYCPECMKAMAIGSEKIDYGKRP